MIKLNEFVVTPEQDEKIQCHKPEVPNFWGGYYAVFKPQSTKLWVKKWFANNKSKSFAEAYFTESVIDAHKNWSYYLKQAL